MNQKERKQLEHVRGSLIQALRSCGEIPSTVALSALVELMVDSAVSMLGKEQAVDAICRTVNILMTSKYQ
jgi:hypothetical protein